MNTDLLQEFKLDWSLSGKAPRTADMYVSYLAEFFCGEWSATLADAKKWLLSTEHLSVRRKRAQALRAFSGWCLRNGVSGMEWAREVPLSADKIVPQETATPDDYAAALNVLKDSRNRAVVEILWSCGLRRSELARLQVSDVDLAGSFIVVRQSKTGKPRIAPLSPAAKRSIRKLLGTRTDGSLFGMTSNAIRLMLQHNHLPSSHAWRRGWAVQSLRSGVSEASVRAAAGWVSGAMVARYTSALSGELAVAEFARTWQSDSRTG
jgi:integrase